MQTLSTFVYFCVLYYLQYEFCIGGDFDCCRIDWFMTSLTDSNYFYQVVFLSPLISLANDILLKQVNTKAGD